MAGVLAGKQILVVEDEYFIASDLNRALLAEEAVVIGPVGQLKQALSLLHGALPDAAILDVNLEGALSFPIADRLAGLAVPFMFLTGYDGWALPERYRAVPRIIKPFPLTKVLACVCDLVGMEIKP